MTGARAPHPAEILAARPTPDTAGGWKQLATGMLSDPCCAFHRNLEISARYAWLYSMRPALFKWAAMAAIASHHVRLALFPLRLDTDRRGFVDIPRSLGRRRLLTEDVNTIRETNNAIFDDIFWVHLAYASSAGMEGLGSLLDEKKRYGQVLAGFAAIEEGRTSLEAPGASSETRRAAEELIWTGNVLLLEHEQRMLVQPGFDRLSCAFARLVSIGSATSFEVRGLRHEVGYFTSFYGFSLSRGLPTVLHARTWPRITRYDDRWSWLVTSVVPRFRRLDAESGLMRASLRRIITEASAYASMPCLPPLQTA